MNITSSSAQIRLDGLDKMSGINISNDVSGYCARLEFWGEPSAYLATHKDSPFPVVVVAPSATWKNDLRDAGYTLIGSLKSLIAEHASKPADAAQLSDGASGGRE